MENIVAELIKIDEVAKRVTVQMEEDRKNLPRRIEQKAEEINREWEEKTKKQVKEIKEKALDESNRKVSEIILSTQKKYAELERDFAENREKWQDEIFKRIIGR